MDQQLAQGAITNQPVTHQPAAAELVDAWVFSRLTPAPAASEHPQPPTRTPATQQAESTGRRSFDPYAVGAAALGAALVALAIFGG